MDKEFHSEVAETVKKTIGFINNGIKYGRNKWFYNLNILKSSDSHELIRAGK